MKSHHRPIPTRCGLWVAAALLTAATAQAQVVTGGLHTPYKLTTTPGGNFLVTEGGTGVNDGAVTLLTGYGARFNLLSGLPSGLVPEGAALGPTAVAQSHRTLYVVIGEGDVLGDSGGPGQVPNPEALSSPIFSSLIRARFSPVPDGIRQGFTLGAVEVRALADGREVSLDNDAGEHVDLLLLADFRDLEPDPFLGVRQSDPFAAAIVGSLTAADLTELGFGGATLPAANFFARLNPDTPIGRRLEERTTIYVVDAGMNTVVAVDAATGRQRVAARVPPLPNPLFPNLGGPVMDPVPTGIFATADGHLLVTLLPGFPFPVGGARVLRIDPATGAMTPAIEGLTAATDVLQIGSDTYVLSVFSDFLAGIPGQLVRVDADGHQQVVAGGLIGAAGMAYDPRHSAILVTESFTGLVKRIPLTLP